MSIFRLIRILTVDQEIEVVHIHGAAKGSLLRKSIMAAIARKFGKKVIYHSHGSELKDFYLRSSKFLRKRIAGFFEKVDLVICLSQEWKAFFCEHFSLKQIEVLENIVEEPGPDLISKPNQGFPLRILFLGLIGTRKGVFDLLEVLSKNKEEFEGKLIVSIGGRGETDKLESFVKDKQLEKLVHFEGWVTGIRKDELLKNADVYILPSYNEGLPISILEAMSFGLPIISTNVGGIPQVVNNNFNGFIIQPGDKDAIQKSLTFFLQNIDQIEVMGRNSRKIVEPFYAKNVIPKLKSFYS